jgi:outer membrane protein assembly factor BamB
VQQVSAVRWRWLVVPAVAVLVLAAAGLAWAWLAPADQRQVHVVRTMGITALALPLLVTWVFVWLLFLSRLPWSRRLLAAAGLATALGLAAASVRIRGVSGDVVPLLTWRWTTAPGDLPREAAQPRSGPRSAREPAAGSADWPGFLGPARDGVVAGVRLARDWSAAPPRRLWSRSIGAGWSSFAVAGSHVVTHEQRGEDELVTSYDLLSGTPRWTHADPARFENAIAGSGPRATPAIANGRVYALGATGILNVLDLETGERLWSTNVVEDAAASIPTYGVSASPLVVDGWVVVAAGGPSGRSVVAYERETGARAWAGGSAAAAYSSPMLAELGGVRQILLLDAEGLAGHVVGSGEVLWSHPWPQGTERVSQPVLLSDDRVFVSTGYGVGGRLLHVGPGGDGRVTARVLWESLGLKAKLTNVVHHDGPLYGLDDGILACLDVATGERRWKGGRYGHGQLLRVDDLLLVLGEHGSVALVSATPDGFRELGSFAALEEKTWSHPALAGRYLLVRNDREAACFELPLEG